MRARAKTLVSLKASRASQKTSRCVKEIRALNPRFLTRAQESIAHLWLTHVGDQPSAK